MYTTARATKLMIGDGEAAELSVDLLAQIVGRLLEATDVKAWRLVCRAFWRAEALHRRALCVLRRERLQRLLVTYSSLERLDLSVCAALDDATLAAALAPLAGELNLKRVCLARATGVGWRGIETLICACPLLEEVDLSHCVGVGDREAAAVSAARRLRELRLDKCLAVTDVGLANIAVGCPQLEQLGIKWCLEISDIGIDLLAKKCRELRVLDISYLKVGNESLRSLSTLEKLEELSLVGCNFLDDEGLEHLCEAKNSLKSVNISRCDHVTSLGMAPLLEAHQSLVKFYAGDCFHELSPMFLINLSHLRDTLTVLKLDGVQVSTTGLQIIGSNCKNLVEIGLSKCSGVTDDGISSLVTCCRKLHTIDLTCCHLLTNIALASIGDNCKNLSCLQLESCSFITDKGLNCITQSCSFLQEIDLTDCNVNDTGLQCLAQCSEVTTLKLGLCSGISDEGIRYISSSCQKLLELDLYRCAAITDVGLQFIAAGCKKMKKLNLCYCSFVTDAGLLHLSSLNVLSSLELRCLIRITSLGVTSIAAGCKSLVELDLKRCYSVDDSAIWALAQYAEKLRQLTISYCQVTGLGLCHLLGTARSLQDVKLVHLSWVSIEGFEIALRSGCGRLKKLKLLSRLKEVLSPELLQMLQARGCRIRWVNKPLIYKG